MSHFSIMVSNGNNIQSCIAKKLPEMVATKQICDIWDKYTHIALIEHTGHNIKVNVVKGAFNHV